MTLKVFECGHIYVPENHWIEFLNPTRDHFGGIRCFVDTPPNGHIELIFRKITDF